MELAVIRHTRLDIDAGRCYGQSEIALADTFDTELANLHNRLSPPYSAVYSSPLQRCLQLARQFSDSIETDARLLEYDFGDWELNRWDDIDAAALDAWMQDFVNVNAPNGESLVQMYARVAAFMETLRDRDHPHCLIVTHSGVIRCIWAYLLQIPLAEIFKLEVGYGEVLRCRLAANSQEDVVYARG
jgi:alpha-ribazole phosphatase